MGKFLIPTNTDPDDWCAWVVCVPNDDEWRRVFVGTVYLLTRGRSWDRGTGTITDAQRVGWEVFNSMSCFSLTELAESLSTGLGAVAEALQAQAEATRACCASGGVSGPPVPVDTVGEDSGETGDEGTTPPGFDDQAEYNQEKCRAANNIVQNAIDDLDWIASYDDIIRATIAAAVAMLPFIATPIPGDELVVFLGVLTTLLLMDAAIALTLSAAIQTHRENIVCALYSAGSVSSARNNLRDALENAIAADGSAVVPDALEVELAMLYIAGWWNLNQLFEPVTGGQPVIDSPVDCAQCPKPWYIVAGIGDDLQDIESELINNDYRAVVRFSQPVTLTLETITGFSNSINHAFGVSSILYPDPVGVTDLDIASIDPWTPSPPTTWSGAGHIQIVSETPFTFSLTYVVE